MRDINGGPGPGPIPYPGAPAYGAQQYAPDGTPLGEITVTTAGYEVTATDRSRLFILSAALVTGLEKRGSRSGG